MGDISFTGSMPEFYDRCLGPAWFDGFAADLARRLPVQPPGDVLEIACGTGRDIDRLDIEAPRMVFGLPAGGRRLMQPATATLPPSSRAKWCTANPGQPEPCPVASCVAAPLRPREASIPRRRQA